MAVNRSEATTSPSEPNRATRGVTIGVYSTHERAQEAVLALQGAGFDMTRLSIVGRGYHTDEHVVGFYNTGDRIKVWGKRGAFWGAVIGVLVNPALLFLPVVGHVLILGPLASALMAAIDGGLLGGAASALAAALASIGVPHDAIVRYETAIAADKFLLIAHGSSDELRHARDVLRGTQTKDVSVHAEPSAAGVPTATHH